MSIRLSTLRLLFAFAGIVVVLLSGLSGQVARADSTTLSYTGTEQNFVVPSGVTALSIVAVGAKGGDGQNSGLASPGAGGFGDRVAADLAVSPGQIVYINVGGNGGLITPGGNGGGSGGLATFDYSGGGGGGATDVRLVSHDETSRVIVAGGGGGGGAAGAFNHNAGSGGNAGSNGGNGFGSGGQTGTSSGPGLGGGSTGCGGSGAAGSGAAGGDGSGASGWSGGGGGGGGYFGGGGGSSENCVGGGGGGGGGSSTAGAGTSNVSVATDATGVPQVTIHWDALAIVCGNGVVEAGEECDDGDLLPGDCCSPTCRNEPPTNSCTDNDACTAGDVCGGGTCAGTPISCHDNNVCTADGCDPTTGCVFTNNSNPCNDGNACTAGDRCNAGSCQSGSPVVCDDNNPCTTDVCDPETGCVYTNNTDACDDGNACTLGDVCGDGVCAGTAISCNDDNPCTTDTCGATGCIYTNNTNACDDGNVCTLGDVCGGGTCAGTAIACSDDNPCTTDTCNPATGCVFSNNTSPCDDGNACTLSDVCGGGTCAGSAITCNDNNPCTIDACTAFGCVHTNTANACNDGNACTSGDVCRHGACTGTAVACNDNNACTTDSCNPATGCVFTDNTSPCSDGNACTTGDACSGGACRGGAPRACNDNNACTTDTCNPATGCVFTNNTLACNDGNACTTNDACSGGACAGQAIAVANHLVISQIQTRGNGSAPARDEFIEIYNPTSASISAAHLAVRYKPVGSNAITTILNIPSTAAAVVPAHGWLLLTGSGYNGSATPDFTYASMDLPPGGGTVYLGPANGNVTCTSNKIIDKVAWGNGDCAETTPTAAPGANNSAARLPASTCGNGQDTNNNAADFIPMVPSTPRN